MTAPLDTLLTLTGIGITPYSAVGLKHTLRPIDAAGDLQRTVNGELIDLSRPQFRKFALTIASDGNTQPPSFNGVWPGTEVTVGLASELAFPTATGTQDRPDAGDTAEPAVRTLDDYTIYRPLLEMMVMNWSGAYAEWEAGQSWTLELQERI